MRLGLLLLACTGCLPQDRLIPCGTLLCPLDATCIADRCVPNESLAACSGHEDGFGCATSSLTQGVCSAGECVAPGCGNGVVEGDEICDDHNMVNADGCTGDCGAVDTCPALGTTPQFSPLVKRALVQRCTNYATSEAGDLALAICEFVVGPGMFVQRLAQGAPGQLLMPVTGLEVANASAGDASLAPEGNELYVLWYISGGAVELHAYGVVAGAWIDRGAITMPVGLDHGITLGIPSRGPVRRMLVTTGLQASDLHEIEIRDDMTVTELATPFTRANTLRANLSPDGLRAVGGDFNGAFYADRPTLDAAFSTLVTPPGLPDAAVPSMTANCERMYFDGYDSIFYVVQQ